VYIGGPDVGRCWMASDVGACIVRTGSSDGACLARSDSGEDNFLMLLLLWFLAVFSCFFYVHSFIFSQSTFVINYKLLGHYRWRVS
jgi:hypothetical protein